MLSCCRPPLTKNSSKMIYIVSYFIHTGIIRNSDWKVYTRYMPKENSKITVDNVDRLCRSESDRMIAGVCAGIADYFGIDSSLIRILFITITLFGGAGIALYVLLWILIPSESAAKKAVPVKADNPKGMTRGLFGLFIAENLKKRKNARFPKRAFYSAKSFFPKIS